VWRARQVTALGPDLFGRAAVVFIAGGTMGAGGSMVRDSVFDVACPGCGFIVGYGCAIMRRCSRQICPPGAGSCLALILDGTGEVVMGDRPAGDQFRVSAAKFGGPGSGTCAGRRSVRAGAFHRHTS
jgi:hypothetical protein